ncbi:MAG: molybdopterin-guanine dinucleotide biosynthesis protein B [Actinomycetota bacterium]
MVSFAGPSGTGKTTLLEGVITRLTAMGYRVAAVKHDAHRIELDTEGKDSWRLRRAGADSTLLMGRDQMAWFGSDGAGPDLNQAVGLFASTADLVVVEGFRSAGLPTVIVAREGHGDGRWEPPDPALVLTTAHPADVDDVTELLRQRFLT